MFRFNFDIDDNHSQENPQLPGEESAATNQQPFGCLNIDEIDQSIVQEMKLPLDGTDLIPNVYEGRR